MALIKINTAKALRIYLSVVLTLNLLQSEEFSISHQFPCFIICCQSLSSSIVLTIQNYQIW